MLDDDRRRLLGDFVRSHRERVTPDQPVRRRRTPGLRREELAARAGIGVTWCAWIEQGRDISVSPHALARLAQALALTPAERAYLFELAGRRDPAAAPLAAVAAAPEAVLSLVMALPFPAYGLDRLWNVSCWNDRARHLFTPWLEAGHQRNLLRYTFLSPAARSLLPDWENRARRLLAEFRADYVRLANDPALDDLTRDLCAQSPLFAQEWARQSVLAREGGARSFRHPADGMQHFTQHTFSTPERPDHKLVALVPTGEGGPGFEPPC